jgi:hypothetical protein
LSDGGQTRIEDFGISIHVLDCKDGYKALLLKMVLKASP